MTESLVFGVSLDPAPTVAVAGRTWHRRPELHVTTCTPDDLAAATGLEEQAIADAAETLRAELSAVRPVRFDGHVAEAAAGDGRRTLVAFCDVEGLDTLFARLSALTGADLPRPPAHVTLYTSEPGMRGIGLTTQDAVEARTQPLPTEAASEVLRAAGIEAGRWLLHGKPAQRMAEEGGPPA